MPLANSPQPLPCTRCGYNLAGVPVADARIMCPECGLAQAIPVVGTAAASPITPHGWTRPLLTLTLLPAALFLIGWLCDSAGLPRSIGEGILTMSVISFAAGPVCYAIGGSIHALACRRSIGRPVLVAFEGFVLGGVCLWLLAMLLASTLGYLT